MMTKAAIKYSSWQILRNFGEYGTEIFIFVVAAGTLSLTRSPEFKEVR